MSLVYYFFHKENAEPAYGPILGGKRQIGVWALQRVVGNAAVHERERQSLRAFAAVTPDRNDPFAVRISGRSMEPKFHDKDIILVENADAVNPGDLCVYVLDGCGYFKVFGGDCLISLNPEFGKIMLRDYESVSCAGKVIGKLRKSVAR